MRYTPFADFICAGRRVRMAAGGFIGRAAQASLRLVNPSVSEAHALLTCRDRELRLQALRGTLRLDREPLQEIVLRAGMEIRLSDDVTLTVERVVISAVSLALIVLGKIGVIPRLPCSLILADESADLSPDLSIEPFVVVHDRLPFARLAFYEDDQALWSVSPAGPPEPVRLPAQWQVGAQAVRLVSVPLSDTPATFGGLKYGRLRICCRYDSVHIWVGVSQKPELFAGKPARIISEIVALGRGPVSWEVVAREVWGHEEDRILLRGRWDKALQGLRRQFRSRGVRDDLITIDGHGNVELVLYADDSVMDET